MEICVCTEYDLKQYDTLYHYQQYDNAVAFEHILNIKYCPVCGKKLPENWIQKCNTTT